MEQSNSWSFNSVDAIKIAKALGWSLVSCVIGAIIAIEPLIGVPAKYAVIVGLLLPTINTVLYAAYRFAKGKGNIPQPPSPPVS